jgi:hypothetical protein
MNGRNQRGLKFTLENEAQRVFGFCRSGWLPLSGACDFTVPSTNRFFLREKTKGNVPLLFLIISLSLSLSLSLCVLGFESALLLSSSFLLKWRGS